jgi:hypothetical protein
MKITKIIFVVFMLLTTFSCQGKTIGVAHSRFLSFPLNHNHLDSHELTEYWRSEFLNKDSTKLYADIKTEIVQIKSAIFSKGLSYDSLGSLFTDLLVYGIIPYWYGTAWTFEGHTALPNQGEIACGYFVSTTLLHAGVNINRYKLAQQLPVHEAASLALSDSVLVISQITTAEIIQEMQRQTIEGIYFLGFDQSHVGFLLNRKNQLFVIHSNYVGGIVTIERIEESLAFASYKKFYVCPLSTNKNFLKKWKKNEVIQVIETP